MIKQITLRQVPDAVEKGIRMRAKRTNRSMNRAMIDLMEEALGVKSPEKKKRDISSLVGQWTDQECEAFDRNTEVFERLDEENWKP